jgi:predicted phage gp36 major capsid-like protein
MTPEPRFFETLIAKKERRAIEAKAAWDEHKAIQLAVDKNMARLREIRLAQEALKEGPAAAVCRRTGKKTPAAFPAGLQGIRRTGRGATLHVRSHAS